MWLPRDSRFTSSVTDDCQLFFLQLWHSMVHRSAADSFRMRCMNSVNVLEELASLIQKHAQGLPDEWDIKMVAEEAKDILSNDPIVRRHFAKETTLLVPLLDEIKKTDVSGDHKKKLLPTYRLLSYYLRDVCGILNEKYRTRLIEDLDSALFSTKSIESVFQYTGALLSLLVHEGYSIESLYALFQYTLLHDGRPLSLRANFDFCKDRLQSPQKDYEIVFRMEGFTHDPPDSIAAFEFLREYTMPGANERVGAILSPGQNVLFAKTTTKGRDGRSAGLQARKALDDILDLIRFELEMEVITVRPNFVSTETDSDKIYVFPLPNQIPNPKRNVPPDEFMGFVEKIGEVLESKSLDPSSREKIKSAFHFYRTGRDTEQLENKFLNWWTALEYLVKTGEQGKIMPEIEKRLVPILILGYAGKHLRNYSKILYFCRKRLSANGVAKFGVPDYKDLNPLHFFGLLNDPNEFREIETALTRYPSLLFYLRRFKEQMRDAKTIKAFYDRYQRLVTWHINRIYRTRCDIVHSAEYSMNLTLLSANLEYYLKYVLTAILENLTYNKDMSSLTELYDRTNYTLACLKKDLSNDRTNFYDELLMAGENLALPCT